MIPEDELDEAAVRAELTTTWLGRSYQYTAALDSTNERLRARAADPALPSGTVLLTDFQSAGRGRLGRRWEAPAATSLLFSVLFRPGWPARRGAWLTMLGGLAVAEAVEAATGLRVGLKWPNDVVILMDEGAAWRKVCGLLLEAMLDADGRVESAVLGVGLNVNTPPDQLPDAPTPATSLLAAGGQFVPRRPLLLTVLQGMERRYDAAAGGRSPAGVWAKRLVTLGHEVTVSAAGAPPLSGRAEGVDEWGQLMVRDAAGTLHTVAAGDVSLRPS